MVQTGDKGRFMNKRILLIGAAVFVAGLVLGALFLGGGGTPPPAGTAVDAEHADHAAEAAEAAIWTCSMHPQIQLPEPGKCPICFMDLIPLEDDDSGQGETRLSMSPEAVKLAQVVTAPVRRGFAAATVRTVGKVAVDERRLKKITAWVGGRLDRLYVDYTGIPVRKGDHLVEIYSPELYSAQVELIEAVRAQRDLARSGAGLVRETADATVEASREKLRLLGLKDSQIAGIEASESPDEHVVIYAPVEGIVVHKQAVEGDYVRTGSPIYTIAELSRVWVMMDVYESDLVWVKYGQRVEFEVEAYPGIVFEGRIAFIDPVVNPETRTVKVRVNAENPGLRLKPEMFVHAVISSEFAADGSVIAPDLAGKWIGPMHPEVVKDRPGTCDICGMPLVPAEELGFVTDREDAEPPLLIPASAPLITGTRAVVYVEVPDTEKPTFEGREIVLGPRAGDSYVVLAGLHEGEAVVVKGNFKIDSAMQIQAKPSMMSPEGGAPAPGHRHGEGGETAGEPPAAGPQSRPVTHLEEILPALQAAAPVVEGSAPALYDAYFALQGALAADDADAARDAAESLRTAIESMDEAGLTGDARDALGQWMEAAGEAAGEMRDRDLADLRRVFERVTGLVLLLERAVGPPEGESHHLLFCPMAFDNRGATWLQSDTDVHNPYFGASMLKCGAVRETFGTAGEAGEDALKEREDR